MTLGYSESNISLWSSRARVLLHPDERHSPVSLNVLTLDSIGFAFALYRVLARSRIELSAEMLQIMNEFMDH